jgi:hypothetical protein
LDLTDARMAVMAERMGIMPVVGALGGAVMIVWLWELEFLWEVAAGRL